MSKVSGSKRQPLPGAMRTADADPNEQVTVTMIVRRRPGATLTPPGTPQGGSTEARAELRRRFAEQAGADPAELAAVARFATGAGLRVLQQDAGRRSVVVEGTVEQMSRAFGVSLGRYEAEGVTYRGREGEVTVPPELDAIVEAVLGLDNRPQAHTHYKWGGPIDDATMPHPAQDPMALLPELGDLQPAASAAGAKPRPKPGPLWATQVARLYGFPTDANGQGEAIAIIELGGGYTDADLQGYFAKAGVAPAPTVIAVPVDNGSNNPGPDPNADGEVLLDIEVSGSIAPAATIVVYFADTSDRGFLDAITTAVHDTQHAPSVVSISWGGPEASWTAQSMKAMDAAMQDAQALGVTVLVAAGDHGAGDGTGNGKVNADFPASSPNAVACGGTTLVGRNGAVVSEVAWNDQDGWATGGGISETFPVPSWQTVTMPANLNGSGPGRGLPDVAGNADITSGYMVLVSGKWGPIGGTSAVAPLYAGLVACLNQKLGRPVHALPSSLYGLPAAAFRDVTSGNNAVPKSQFGPATAGYPSGKGWDACTGLGSLHGGALATSL